jgi:hypothetical protein
MGEGKAPDSQGAFPVGADWAHLVARTAVDEEEKRNGDSDRKRGDVLLRTSVQ